MKKKKKRTQPGGSADRRDGDDLACRRTRRGDDADVDDDDDDDDGKEGLVALRLERETALAVDRMEALDIFEAAACRGSGLIALGLLTKKGGRETKNLGKSFFLPRRNEQEKNDIFFPHLDTTSADLHHKPKKISFFLSIHVHCLFSRTSLSLSKKHPPRSLLFKPCAPPPCAPLPSLRAEEPRASPRRLLAASSAVAPLSSPSALRR